jgi:5-methylcytosine-specific restriction endonuclease McrA
MTYKEQLLQPEWRAKREEILARDNCQCKGCGKQRSEFRSLVKFSDISDKDESVFRNVNELKAEGYQFMLKSNQDNSALILLRGNWLEGATYIGDKFRDFVLDELLFCKKFKYANSKERPELFFFYKDTIDNQGRVDLNIHHKYYISGRKAWEYDNDALVLLCSDCHKKTHQEEVIYVYAPVKHESVKSEIDYAASICNRCGGAGILPEFYYNQKGVCFGCGGAGVTGI